MNTNEPTLSMSLQYIVYRKYLSILNLLLWAKCQDEHNINSSVLVLRVLKVEKCELNEALNV